MSIIVAGPCEAPWTDSIVSGKDPTVSFSSTHVDFMRESNNELFKLERLERFDRLFLDPVSGWLPKAMGF